MEIVAAERRCRRSPDWGIMEGYLEEALSKLGLEGLVGVQQGKDIPPMPDSVCDGVAGWGGASP